MIGKADHIPDIGHFIKCISGRLHNLAKQNSHLRGVHLLEAAQIKTVCADISRIIRKYGVQLRQLNHEDIESRRNTAMNRLSCVVPHHCGDHSSCCYDDCKMKKLERHAIARYKVEFPQCTETDEWMLDNQRQIIFESFAKQSRFNGKVMSMSERGQATVFKEISKRLDSSNIDRVAMTMSSNDCENFFGMIAKYSHGKIIFLGQTDSWEAYQLLIAGNKSDPFLRIKFLQLMELSPR